MLCFFKRMSVCESTTPSPSALINLESIYRGANELTQDNRTFTYAGTNFEAIFQGLKGYLGKTYYIGYERAQMQNTAATGKLIPARQK